MPLPERYVELEAGVTGLITRHRPNVVAVETLIFNRNITTAMQVSEARGVVILCGARHHLDIQPCTPLQVKMAVAGYGRADKIQIKFMVEKQLGVTKIGGFDDAIDAIAIAITGYHLTAARLAAARSTEIN